jgi:hypothetical protein
MAAHHDGQSRRTRPDHRHPTGSRRLLDRDPLGHPRPRLLPHSGRPGIPGRLRSRAHPRRQVGKAGHRDTRAWKAAWGLHQAATSFANWVMGYTSPGRPGEVGDAERIVDVLGQRPRSLQDRGPARAAALCKCPGDTQSPVARASTSFPVSASPVTALRDTGPSRTAAVAIRQLYPAHHR